MILFQALLENAAGSTVQSKNVFPDTFELVYELRVKEPEGGNILYRCSAAMKEYME